MGIVLFKQHWKIFNKVSFSNLIVETFAVVLNKPCLEP